jgi:hypothetical protein
LTTEPRSLSIYRRIADAWPANKSVPVIQRDETANDKARKNIYHSNHKRLSSMLDLHQQQVVHCPHGNQNQRQQTGTWRDLLAYEKKRIY